MSKPARAAWPQCCALARSTGKRCRASAVLGTRCWLHCGATINAGWGDPKPTWSVYVVPSGVKLSPSRKGHGRTPSERRRFSKQWPKRIRWWAAVELVVRGRVHRAVFLGGEGKRFRAAVQARGVKIRTRHDDRHVSEVRFKAPPWEAAEPKASKANMGKERRNVR